MPAPKKLSVNSSKRYRIGIDCRLAGVQNSGIGRYISQLVHQLLLVKDSDIRFILFCRNQDQAKQLSANYLADNFQIVICDIGHYSVQEQILLPYIYYRAKLDLLHVPHFNTPLINPLPTVVTIHDLLWHQYRGTEVTTLSPLMYLIKYQFYKLVVSWSVKRARAILVPSETINQTVQNFYPESNRKIKTTYEGLTDFPTITDCSLKPSFKYLLYVGNLYPHKNVEIILAALQKLPNQHLVICGSRDAFSQKVLNSAQQLDVKSRVLHLGKVSDAQLKCLYQNAQALIQPSKSEGFGLTGLEAMSLNCPVIASDIPIFREIYRDGASFFDPHDPDALVSTIKNLTDSTLLANLRQKQKVLLKRYDWSRMAHETLQVYRSILLD